MKLKTYTKLIQQLPYNEQSFETNMKTWVSFKNNILFENFFNKTFENNTKTISRLDLFKIAETDFNDAVFSIIMWGYPRGYTRGNTMNKLFPLFLDGIQILKSSFSLNQNLTITELNQIIKNVKGVGLSTLTKFLYFFNTTIENNKSLILDSRIINVLKLQKFEELNCLKLSYKAEDYYIEYLELMNKLSTQNQYKPDQLELFLFMFGNNLKD